MNFDPRTAQLLVPASGDPVQETFDFDPVKATLIEDDFFSFKGIADTAKRAPGLIKENWKRGQLGNEAATVLAIEKYALDEETNYPGTEWARILAQEAAARREALGKKQDELFALSEENQATAPQNPTYARKIAEMVAGNAPSTVATLGTLLLSRAGAGGAAGALGAGNLAVMARQTQGQVRQKDYAPLPGEGPSKPVNATVEISAFAQGASELVTEIMPMRDVIKLGKGPFREWFKKYFLHDLTGEEVNAVWQAVVEEGAADSKKPIGQFMQELGQNMLDTAAVAGVQAGIVGGTAKAIGVKQEAEEGKEEEGKEGKEEENVITYAPPQAPSGPEIIFTDTEAGLTELAPFITEADTVLARTEEADGKKLAPGGTVETPESAVETPGGAVETVNDLTGEAKAEYEAWLDMVNKQTKAETEAAVINIRAKALDTRLHSPDAGMTAEVAQNLHNFEDPNTPVPRSTRRITAVAGKGKMSQAAAQGLTFGQLDESYFDTTGGPVVFQLGESSNVRPQHYLNAVIKEIFSLAKKYNPTGIYAILPEDVITADNELKKLGFHFKQDGIHYINPRWLTNILEQGSHISKPDIRHAYNYNAKLQAGSTIWHEFGHSLLEDFIFAGANEAEQILLRQGLETGQVNEEALQKLAPEAQALIRRYLALKQAAETGQMSGHETAARFLSPAKIANTTFMKENFRIPEPVLRNTAFPAHRIVTPLQEANWWNFFEFAAEQMAKVYFEPETLKKSKLTKALFPEGFISSELDGALNRFFAPLLKVLQKVFHSLKTRGFVKPEAEFTAWLKMLANGQVPEEVAEAQKQLETKKPGKAARPSPSELQAEINWESKDIQATLKAALVSLVKDRAISASSYKELQGLLKNNQYEEFVDLIEPMLEKKLRFDIGGKRAKTADLTKLRQAQALALADVPMETIWKKTGWYMQPDFKWRFEIDPSKARLKKWPKFVAFPLMGTDTLEEVLDHPELFKAYPQLRKLRIYESAYKYSYGADYANGEIRVGWKPDNAQLGFAEHAPLSIILHEVQHAIQEIEGFAPGGSPQQFLPLNYDEVVTGLQKVRDEYLNSPIANFVLGRIADHIEKKNNFAFGAISNASIKLVLTGGLSEIIRYSTATNAPVAITLESIYSDGVAAISNKIQRMQFAAILEIIKDLQSKKQMSAEALKKYKMLLGEIEATNVQERLLLTPEERKAQMPTIPKDYLIDWTVRYSAEQARQMAAGTKVADFDGEPLIMVHSGEMQWVVDKAQIYLFTGNMLDANWISSLRKETSYTGPLMQYYVQLVTPFEADAQGGQLVPAMLQSWVRVAKANGHDGVVIKNANGFTGPIYISFSRNNHLPVPAAKLQSSQLRFDRTTPEGAQLASVWTVVKEKLSLDTAALAIHKLWRNQFWTLQLQQLAHVHPDWAFLKLWEQLRVKYYRKVAEMHNVADAVTRQLAWLGKEQSALLQRFTEEEYRGREHWTDLVQIGQYRWQHRPAEKLFEKLKKYNIDPDTRKGKKFVELYLEAKNALQYQQDEMEKVLLVLRGKKYAKTLQGQLQGQLAAVRMHFKNLRAHPFWPQQTFGENIVRVYRKDPQFGGKFLAFEAATDSEIKAKAIYEKAKKDYPDGTVIGIKRNAEEAILMRLPVEFLDDIAVALGLDINNPEDKEKLNAVRELMQSVYNRVPGEVYGTEKALVQGGSKEFIRNFADFSLRNSNFIAKMEFRKYFDGTAAMAKEEWNADPFSQRGGDINAALRLMEDSVKYMMNPAEEMHQIRAFIALMYLAGNVKVAVLNLWGLAGLLLFMNRELGYVKGAVNTAKAISAAGWTLGHEGFVRLKNKIIGDSISAAFTSVTNPDWEMENGKPTELRQALEQAKKENVLDQSYAYYLASQSLRGDLMRAANVSVAGKGFKFTVDSGMALFRTVELAVRRATFIGVYSTLQKTRPQLTAEQRYEEAVRITSLLQGDYTKGNKPRIMRGNLLSLITLFMTFVHNASWGAYGGIEMGLKRLEKMEGRPSPKFYRSYTTQMVLLYLAVAGLEGLPFGENILDILDGFFRKFNNGKTARMTLREFFSGLLDDEGVMKVMRGSAFNVAGMDWSRSIGLGRLVPGTDVLAEQHKNARDLYGDIMASTAGIAGGYLTWGIDTAMQVNARLAAGMPLPLVLQQQAAKLPGGAGNVMKAYEWSQHDVRGPSGGLLALDPETGKAREVTTQEIALKALGFQPVSVSLAQEIKAEQRDVQIYWTERRNELLKNLYYAQEIIGDREAMADVKAAIGRFNESAPDAQLRITNKVIQRSFKQREKAQKREERLMPGQKMLESEYDRVRDVYGVE